MYVLGGAGVGRCVLGIATILKKFETTLLKRFLPEHCVFRGTSKKNIKF
jgi:hypothetical protein